MTHPRSRKPDTRGNADERSPRLAREALDPAYWVLLDDLEIHREELAIRADQLAEAQSALESVENLLADAPLGYLTLDDLGTIQECNRTAGAMLGIDPRSAPGWSLTLFTPRPHERGLLDHLLRCRHGEDPVRTELTLKSRNQKSFPCQLVTRQAPLADGHRRYRTAILDLTDRRRVEDALRRTERRFSAAVEASGAGLFELEIPFEGLLYLSHRLAEIFGYTRSELAEPMKLPRWIHQRLHPDDRDLVQSVYRELASKKRDAYHGDVRFRHKDGSWRWIRIWTKAASTEESATRELVGVVMDVTVEKERAMETERRARQLRALAAELFNVEERERRELATELHDNLAQLIAATKMKLGVIAPSEDAKQLKQQVDEAFELLDRADASVRSLSFSLSPPVLDELGLTSAVKWLAKDMHKQFGLEIDLVEEGDMVLADPRLRFMLFRSVRELLINAAKHGHSPRARMLLEAVGGAVRIVVEDQGDGFDVNRARAEGPRGFGLFSIQERVESIGGTMTVRSSPGHGTSVTLFIDRGSETLDTPRAKTDAVSAGVPRRASSAGRRDRIRILLADDHELVRTALARLLDAQSDLEVIGEASDGESALELVALLTPDVIVMDVTMAGVGGIEATRRISSEHPEARVIGLSMHESGDIASAMKEAGAFDYLRKSSPTDVLLDTIRKAAGNVRQTSPGGLALTSQEVAPGCAGAVRSRSRSQ